MTNASKPCPKCSATSGNDWSQCRGSCPMPMSPHYDRRGQGGVPTKHAFVGSYAVQAARGAQGMLLPEDRLCAQPHYAAIVEATKDVEIYQLGDLDCASCLRLMADKHAALAEVFRAKLAALGGEP